MNQKNLVSGDAVLFLRYISIHHSSELQLCYWCEVSTGLAMTNFYREPTIYSVFQIIAAYECLSRGENGELRLGIRRAVRPRNGLPESVIGNKNCYPNFLSSVANAISTKSMFHVFYSPRY